MYWIDIAALILTLVLAYKARQQGLLTSLTRLTGLVIGIIIAVKMGYGVGNSLVNQFDISQQLANIIAHIIVFVLVILVAQIIGYLLRSVVHAVKLGWLDKIGGILLGVLKSAIIISFLFWILLALPSKTLGDDIQNKSIAYNILGKFAPSLYVKYIEPNLNDSDIKNRLDSLGIHKENLLPMVSEFDKQVEILVPNDPKIAESMKEKFKSLPFSQQKLIISKLLEENIDLQEIINILYESE